MYKNKDGKLLKQRKENKDLTGIPVCSRVEIRTEVMNRLLQCEQ